MELVITESLLERKNPQYHGTDVAQVARLLGKSI